MNYQWHNCSAWRRRKIKADSLDVGIVSIAWVVEKERFPTNLVHELSNSESEFRNVWFAIANEGFVLLGDVSRMRHTVSGFTSVNELVFAGGAECQRLAPPRGSASL